MRLAYYAGASTAAAVACLLKAFHERPNFYSASVYLSQSNACLLILTNLLLVLACSFMYWMQRLLYGPLRPIEVEQLSEKAWYAVLDTLLAMPSFRDDVGGWLLAMFTLLLAGKVWGWIGEGKVDVLEQQPPANPWLFHARLATSLVVSVVFDIYMFKYCVESIIADPKPGMMVIFTFEFAILLLCSVFTLCRYGLTLYQIYKEKKQLKEAIQERKEEIRTERAAARQREAADGQPSASTPANEEPIEVDENEVDVPGWEEKRRALFVLEVLTDFCKLIVYTAFFTVSITFNGLPMHIMRDVYMTFASFSKRVTDYVAYRKATSDMNTRYPDATTEEIRGDACIVCRESMVAWEQPNSQAQPQSADQQPAAAPATSRRKDEGLRAKKLPCGHILHLRCLKAWLERQQVCPTCRRPVVVRPDPAAAAQQGNGQANDAARGQQQGGQGNQRPARARILNLGPIRIGFLNGPGDQFGNILRQMQNPQRAAGAQGANQQGPNHLGLQVPYLNGQQGDGQGSGSGRSHQNRIARLEQKIMQDANNLAVDRQQLATLRAMEAELARLRSLYQPAQPAGPGQAQAQVAAQQPQFAQAHGLTPVPPEMTYQHFYPPMPPMPFQGSSSQQFGSGHEHLPQGMTLPEGWTVMPLRRTDPMNVPAASVRPAGMPMANGQPAPANTVPQENVGPNGPTDDNGSPLFVPTAPTVNGTGVATESQPVDSDPSVNREGRQRPWNSEGWSFVEPPNGQTPNGERSSTPSGPANEAGGEEGNAKGKGKAKAVDVEEVPDSED